MTVLLRYCIRSLIVDWITGRTSSHSSLISVSNCQVICFEWVVLPDCTEQIHLTGPNCDLLFSHCGTLLPPARELRQPLEFCAFRSLLNSESSCGRSLGLGAQTVGKHWFLRLVPAKVGRSYRVSRLQVVQSERNTPGRRRRLYFNFSRSSPLSSPLRSMNFTCGNVDHDAMFLQPNMQFQTHVGPVKNVTDLLGSHPIHGRHCIDKYFGMFLIVLRIDVPSGSPLTLCFFLKARNTTLGGFEDSSTRQDHFMTKIGTTLHTKVILEFADILVRPNPLGPITIWPIPLRPTLSRPSLFGPIL